MIWTPDQQKAIDAPCGRGNILVSAAAGSGKTAVLVERVLQKIIGGETTVDRLLIVTFTEAAAAEMREKIIKRLITASEEDREKQRFLKRQIQLAQTADIMTIDAFCNRVVQNNFHAIGIDPGIGISDNAMTELLRAEAVENLFESLYETENSADRQRFARLIDAYASNRSDAGLERMIIYIYKFISSFAEPEQWLDRALKMYTLPATEMFHAQYMKNISKTAAKHCIGQLDAFDRDNTSEMLSEYSAEMRAAMKAVVNAEDWDGIYAVYDEFVKKKRGKNKNMLQLPPEAENESFRDMRQRLRFIRQMCWDSLENGVKVSAAQLEEDSGRLFAQTEDIVWIVKLFMEEYERVKDKHGVREFSDIEHMTYRLFRDHEDIRGAYKKKYDEILIDEYQDTNGLQDSIFEMISHDNIFMVGDLKQSIYRFRGGDPYIFKEKSERYEKEYERDTKIVLSQNFRSRYEILSSVNDIFGCIMSREAGDVEYTGGEMLVRDRERDYYPAPNNDCRSELHYIMVDKTDGSDKSAEEIRFVCDKIKELLSSGAAVYDRENNRMRPIKKKDIVILENSVKSNGEEIVRQLSERGINAFTETESFFSRREIRVMLSLISVINNARQDIPLVAVMRSPIGGFSENDLARIRLNGRDGSFISAVRAYACGSGIVRNKGTYKYVSGKIITSRKKHKSRLKRKCAGFIADLRRWRSYVRSKSVAQLIWAIYEESYFYDMMGAIEQGEEAQFNLRLLYERARRYEKAGFKGLFNFIGYIEQIESSDEDLGGAKLIGENHDVVRVMTIHKSKGLEFPYVFLIGAGKRFVNKRDVTDISLHKELGIGLPYIYYDRHYMRETRIQDIIERENRSELSSERMRLLYVALTRAREKLYVTASINKKETDCEDLFLEKWRNAVTAGRMLPSAASSAGCFADWLCPAAIISGNWNVVFHDIAGTDDKEAERHEQESETFEDSAELRSAVYDILNYTYPFEKSHTVPSRTSVTQLKELTIERESIYDSEVYEPDSRRSSGAADDFAELMFSPLHSRPAFMRGESERLANEIGTLYHLIMSEIDLQRIASEGTGCIESELDRLIMSGRITERDRKYIDVEKIAAFYESNIGRRLLRSPEVHREAPFQINITAAEYDPSLGRGYENETVILQGIIDCFFRERGEYVLIDYKTDKVRGDGTEIKRKYRKQLELYKKAIEEMTGRLVKESCLYLFDIGKSV